MPTFNVKIQKADGSTEDLIVESKSPLNAKNFLRRRGLKPIEVQISKSNTSSGTEPRERDYVATCELKNGTRTTIDIAAISETAARRELRRRGKRVLKLEPARKQNNSTKMRFHPDGKSSNIMFFFTRQRPLLCPRELKKQKKCC